MPPLLRDGRHVGVSLDCGNVEGACAPPSIATVDIADAELRTEVAVVWGEHPVTAKPQVEGHEQRLIRATVAPAPYVPFA
ncbi:hypothetical protein [Pseudonocardia sp. N23]|uniref:hypothetical protein n=1 Tax=Pseudonocardia sp. N23 TaxID=1987376 RepID=UPI000BFE1066|nr:hypothetical protein [Pseudonocardia sp. N23]GAY07978.1 similar to vanillate/3-O-methylgallate O-demethylase [Pseudonocardia sp. N23]